MSIEEGLYYYYKGKQLRGGEMGMGEEDIPEPRELYHEKYKLKINTPDLIRES